MGKKSEAISKFDKLACRCSVEREAKKWEPGNKLKSDKREARERRRGEANVKIKLSASTELLAVSI